MKYMLDTNMCIYLIKKKPPEVYNTFKKIKISDIGISVITLNEIEYGIAQSSNVKKNRIAFAKFLAPLDVYNYDDTCSPIYGELRTYLERKGTPIGSLDLLIASHALALDCILVSNNISEFTRVPKLKFENWI